MSRSIQLKRIRLVNFHNFVDETISVNGHLFLLGGNGSGKTTVLDSVHFALTAGKYSMELNSAARMAEQPRNLGRSLQGIFLRYDLEKGQRNADKTIGYVALEFAESDDGRRFCIGCGALATSMQATPLIWGFESQTGLEGLNLTEKTADGQLLPVNQDQLKGSGVKVYSRDRYTEVIAARFFDSPTSYRETMKLIAAGKSYRELVSRFRDQSQLFRELLPPPDESGYRQIQESLQEIERMQGALEDQEQRLNALGSLVVELDKAVELREKAARMAYINSDHNYSSVRTRFEEKKSRRVTLDIDLEKNRNEISELAKQIHILESRIEAGRNSDAYRSQQLLIQIKRESERNLQRHSDLEKRIRDHQSDLDAIRKKADSIRENIEDCWQILEKQCESFAGLVDNELASNRNSDNYISRFNILHHALSGQRDSINADIAGLEHSQRDLERKNLAVCRNISQLEKHKEAFPAADKYEELEQQLKTENISHTPLFKMLEPAEDLTGPVARVIEEIIGPQRLCTLFVDGGRIKRARTEIISRPYDIALCEESDRAAPAAVPGGLRRFLRFSGDCAGAAEAYLARLLDRFRFVLTEEAFFKSSEENLVCATGLVRENGSVRRVEADANRFIGSTAREATRRQQLGELEAAKHEIEIELRLVAAKLTEGREQRSNIIRALETIGRFPPEIFKRLQQEYFETEERITAISARKASDEKEHAEIAAEQIRFDEQIKAGESQLSGTDFAALTARIDADMASKKLSEKRLSECRRNEGRLETEVKLCSEKITELEALVQERSADLSRRQSALTALLPELSEGELHDYVYVKMRGQQIRPENRETHWRNADRDLSVQCQKIKSQLEHDTLLNRQFRFEFNEENLKIRDNADKELSALRSEMQQRLDENKLLIQKKNRELFEQLIVNDIVRRLLKEEAGLSRTIKDMNSFLGELSFGNIKYRFKMHLRDEFKEFRDLVHKVSDADAVSREKLQTFFDAHRSMLVREGDSLPDFLDYRKWHDVVLQASTGSDEGVALTRSRLSMGSGGEQSVPNYILLLSLAKVHLDHTGSKIRLILMDEAFYGIDPQRREQLLSFADKLDICLIVAHPELDGVTDALSNTTTLLVEKTIEGDIYLGNFAFNKKTPQGLFDEPTEGPEAIIRVN